MYIILCKLYIMYNVYTLHSDVRSKNYVSANVTKCVIRVDYIFKLYNSVFAKLQHHHSFSKPSRQASTRCQRMRTVLQ